MLNRGKKESAEQVTKETKQGGCIVIIAVPLLCIAFMALYLGLIPSGRVISAVWILDATLHGAPGFAGMEEMAQSSCDLDRTRPRPANYDEDQKALETGYANNMSLYLSNWLAIDENDGDFGGFEYPYSLPQDLNKAKEAYCR